MITQELVINFINKNSLAQEIPSEILISINIDNDELWKSDILDWIDNELKNLKGRNLRKKEREYKEKLLGLLRIINS